jgi:hypothetical protein
MLLWLGCGGNGSGGPIDNRGLGGASGGSTGGASGGGTGGKSSVDATPFLGAWTETQTLTPSGSCTGVTQSFNETGQITVSAGTSSDLIVSSSSGSSCSLPFKITGATQATLANATQCMLNVPNVGNVTVSFDAWTIAINGNAGTESGSGTLFSCPFSMTGTLTR